MRDNDQSDTARLSSTPLNLEVLVVQGGPVRWNQRGNANDLVALLDQYLTEQPADLVVLSELSLTPYFAASRDKSWLTAGHQINDPEIQLLAGLAEEHGAHMVIPFAERNAADNSLYNSTVIVDPDGEFVTGRYCSGPMQGEATQVYRKVHLSENNNTNPGVHEKYFFSPGDGFVVFETDIGTISPIICYDRSFPESWRTIADSGTQIVPVPIATARQERINMLESELRVAAVQNGVFVIAACKGGPETGPDSETLYSGGSSVITPLGNVVSKAPPGEGPFPLRSSMDMVELETHATTYHYQRDRRCTAYTHQHLLSTNQYPGTRDHQGAIT